MAKVSILQMRKNINVTFVTRHSHGMRKGLFAIRNIHDQEWKVKDDEVEPEVFKIDLAHCYDINLLNECLETTLQVYKLEDCYMIDSLKFQCLEHLPDTIANSHFSEAQHILEWSKKYGFCDIEDKVFEIYSTKLNL